MRSGNRPGSHSSLALPYQRPESTQVDYFFNDISFITFQAALVYENFGRDATLNLQEEHKKALKRKLDTLYTAYFFDSVNERLDFIQLENTVQTLTGAEFRLAVKAFVTNIRIVYTMFLTENSFRENSPVRTP
jgi:hypothetical protein